MCDTIAGELLICFHDTDPAGAALIDAIHRGQISHVQVLDDLGARLNRIKLSMRKGIAFKFFRLSVPIGQEAFKINYLHFFYKHFVFDAVKHKRFGPSVHPNVLSNSNYHLQVVPHSILALRSVGGSSSGLGFTFTQTHSDYKKLLGWTPSVTAAQGKRILVLDSGLDPTISCTVVDQKNFVEDSKPNDTTDDHGHGTAVVSVIHDLCSAAEFLIYKVADSKGRASEWDTLAALAADSNADLVNISLAFGLVDRVCNICGRESHSSRSAVFENMLDQLGNVTHGPLLVAAAGNDALSELSYPARFDNVLAIESINLAKEISEFSNRATVDHQGSNHQNIFVLPGGEKIKNSKATEYIGTSSSGQEYYGTSFSTAYATGMIASLWSQSLHINKDRAQLMDHLRNNADSNLPKFSSATHGNGMIQF